MLYKILLFSAYACKAASMGSVEAMESLPAPILLPSCSATAFSSMPEGSLYYRKVNDNPGLLVRDVSVQTEAPQTESAPANVAKYWYDLISYDMTDALDIIEERLAGHRRDFSVFAHNDLHWKREDLNDFLRNSHYPKNGSSSIRSKDFGSIPDNFAPLFKESNNCAVVLLPDEDRKREPICKNLLLSEDFKEIFVFSVQKGRISHRVYQKHRSIGFWH